MSLLALFVLINSDWLEIEAGDQLNPQHCASRSVPAADELIQ